jgi:hypothetical protein
MVLKGWDTDANGNIKVFPFTGVQLATAMDGMSGMLRIEYATEATLKQLSALQVIVTAAQARKFGRVLIELADLLEKKLAADKPEGKPS